MKIISISAILLALAIPVFGQGISFGVKGGLSKDLRFFGSNIWKPGISAGAELLFQTKPKISVGAHIMVHRWKIDANSLADMTGEENVRVTSSKGKIGVIEIFPVGRYLLLNSEAVAAGVDLGAGLIYINGEQGSISYTFEGAYSSGSGTLMLSSAKPYPWIGFGINLGIPVFIGKYLQIKPMYCLYLAGGGTPYNHVSLNIGINFGRRGPST